MEQEFWHERWEKDQIGFHKPDGHPMLHKYWPQLDLAASSRVLVPLCGKSVDMLWLAEQGHQVTGIELSAIAAERFFEENQLKYKKQSRGAFDCYVGQDIEIRVGDIFDMTASEIAAFDAFYDRGALVALPEDMRQSYVEQLMTGLKRAAVGLLITLDYDPSVMNGPPFNIGDEDVGKLYGRYAHVDLLAEQRGLDENDPLRERGLTDAREGVYRIVRI